MEVLTNREKDIVSLVSQGLSNKDIAEKLNISDKTVKNHLFTIFKKLGVYNRTQLALLYVSSTESRG